MRRRLLILATVAAALGVALVALLGVLRSPSSVTSRAAGVDTNGVPTEQVDAVQRAIAGGAVVVDVRKDNEWSAGRLAGSVHIPLADVQDRYRELPKDRMIVTVCTDGGLSYKAAYALRQLGYDAVNLDGGLTAWVAAGLPVVDDAGGPGHILTGAAAN